MIYFFWSKITPFVIVYSCIFICILVNWLLTKKEEEDNLKLKTTGYIMLSAFRFSINNIHLPIGALFSLFLIRKAKQNRLYKIRIIILGIIVSLFSYYPLDVKVDNLFYPKDDIRTYLQEDMDYKNKGFSMTLINEMGTIFASFHEHDEVGRSLYETLLNSEKLNSGVVADNERYTTIILNQDTEEYQERFRRLQFYISNDGEIVSLENSGKIYKFKSSSQFRDLFMSISR